MVDERIITDNEVKMVVEFKNRSVSDLAYIVGLFLGVRKSYPCDSTSEDVALKILNEIPDEIIEQIKRYHGGNFFGHYMGLSAPKVNSLQFLTTELETVKQERDLMRSLLTVAVCPACDGSGSIPHQIAEDEWEAEQCQWCYERKAFLNKLGDKDGTRK